MIHLLVAFELHQERRLSSKVVPIQVEVFGVGVFFFRNLPSHHLRCYLVYQGVLTFERVYHNRFLGHLGRLLIQGTIADLRQGTSIGFLILSHPFFVCVDLV